MSKYVRWKLTVYIYKKLTTSMLILLDKGGEYVQKRKKKKKQEKSIYTRYDEDPSTINDLHARERYSFVSANRMS